MIGRKRAALLDWEDVHAFAALARQRTLAATARALGVPHATVARRVTNLEAALGQPLFTRARDGFELNAAGGEALAEATKMESAASVLAGRCEAPPDISGCVRITVAPDFAEFLTERLAPLLARHRALEVDVVATSRNGSLARRTPAIALRLARPLATGLVARRLATLDYGFYASPGYQARIAAGETPAFITFDADGEHLPEAAWTRRHLAGCRVALRVNSQAAQAAAARSGFGVALLPGLLARNLGALTAVELDDVPPARELWMLMRPDVAKLARTRAVADHLAGIFAPHNSRGPT